MNCRCISVNSQIEHEFPSNIINPYAILIEDINQDNKNELIIGTTSGEILIYKGSLVTPWLKTTKPVGCITCLAYESLVEGKPKHLIVHDALGYVYFFSINQVGSRRRYASDIGSSAKSNLNEYSYKLELNMFYQTKLLINPKYILVDDLYNNGSKKMIVGYTDRLIRVYGWANSTTSNSNSSKNTSNLTQSNTNDIGTIIFESSWELPDQIYSISILKDLTNKKNILVSLSGGRVFQCKLSFAESSTDIMHESNSSSSSSLFDLIKNQTSKQFNRSTSQPVEEIINFFSEINTNDSQRASFAMPSYLVTNVQYNKCDQYSFLVTTNGDIFFFKMMLNSLCRTPIWHRNLAGLVVMNYYKCDINKDGNEELLIATPEGQVFIISCSGDSICLDLGEPVRGFHIGLYSPELAPISTHLIENASTRSEIDLYQTNPAFDLALDIKNDDFLNGSQNSSNTLCFVFWSSITNKICLLQIDTIITYSKLKPSSQLKYKCENIFSKSRNFSNKLNQLLESSTSKKLNSEIIHNLLYNN